MAMNVLLVGGEAAGRQAVGAVTRMGHRLVGVLSPPSEGGFPGAPTLALAGKLGVPTGPARLVKDPRFGDTVRNQGVDIVLNVHSVFVICPEVLAAPRIGAFNLHPGPLPGYAGLNAPSWAIYRGERSHASTLHWMVAEVDAGPVAFCTRFDIEDSDTGVSLALKCVRAGVPLIEQLLAVAADDPGAIPRLEQDLSRREYFKPGPPKGGRLSWERSARAVVDFVRAADYRPFPSPWGHPTTQAGSLEVGVVAARRTGRAADRPPGTVGRVTATEVEVACGDEWVSVTDVVAGGRYARAPEVLRSTGCLGPSSSPVPVVSGG